MNITKKHILIGSIALGICILSIGISLFIHREVDINKVIIEKITSLREKQDKYWLKDGQYLAEQKANIYLKEQEFLKQFNEMDAELKNLMGQLTSTELLPEWTPAHEQYYKGGKPRFSLLQVGGETPSEDTVPSLVPTAHADSSGYTSPDDLYYTCLRSYNCYVTQTDKDHFKSNGYLATDIGTGGQNVPVHVPDYQNMEIEYEVKYTFYPDTTGNTVELFGEHNGSKFMWRIGHIHWEWNGSNYKDILDGGKARTGDILAYSGGETEREDQGATTGKHVHIEYLVWDGVKYAPVPYRIGETVNMHQSVQDKKIEFPVKVGVTSYNPEVAQNDADPWTGAAGVRMQEGMIALSRDLIYGTGNAYNPSSPIKYGAKVRLDSDVSGCAGVYTVQDTMDKRFNNMVDIFKVNRKDNVSCTGTITLL